MAKGFSGIPGGGNMQGLLKQAQKMQAELQKVQEQAGDLTAEGSAGGGVVKIVANGKNQILSVVIDKEVVNPNEIDMLQDLIKAASNEALEKAKNSLQAELSKVTGGVNLPGLF